MAQDVRVSADESAIGGTQIGQETVGRLEWIVVCGVHFYGGFAEFDDGLFVVDLQ